jgi:hypothetical protein
LLKASRKNTGSPSQMGSRFCKAFGEISLMNNGKRWKRQLQQHARKQIGLKKHSHK